MNKGLLLFSNSVTNISFFRIVAEIGLFSDFKGQNFEKVRTILVMKQGFFYILADLFCIYLARY